MLRSVLPSVMELYSIVLIYIPLLIGVYSLVWSIYSLTLHPLSRIPGPLWASISRTWLMYHHWAGDVDIATRELHARYGPIVRIAPDEVTVADPSALPLIYPVQKALQKTDWYVPWRPKGLGSQPDLFTQTDEKAHTTYRRIVGGVYSTSSILKSEVGLDEMLDLFMERLAGFADRGEAFDFGLWLEMWVFSSCMMKGDFLRFANMYEHVGTRLTTLAWRSLAKRLGSCVIASTTTATSMLFILRCPFLRS